MILSVKEVADLYKNGDYEKIKRNIDSMTLSQKALENYLLSAKESFYGILDEYQIFWDKTRMLVIKPPYFFISNDIKKQLETKKIARTSQAKNCSSLELLDLYRKTLFYMGKENTMCRLQEESETEIRAISDSGISIFPSSMINETKYILGGDLDYYVTKKDGLETSVLVSFGDRGRAYTLGAIKSSTNRKLSPPPLNP
ncbi:MAG TPA: hypothetical protein PLC53_03150 [Bacilli bacterium]|nr:hypothetical protein [Bacilli bacterium]